MRVDVAFVKGRANEDGARQTPTNEAGRPAFAANLAGASSSRGGFVHAARL